MRRVLFKNIVRFEFKFKKDYLISKKKIRQKPNELLLIVQAALVGIGGNRESINF